MKKLILCGLLTTSYLAISAQAGTDSGFYIGGSIGQSAADVKTRNINIDDENTAYKIIAGFNFGILPFIDLAVEADYRDFGEFSDKNSTIKSGITAFDLFALGGFNFGPASIFAKVGYSNGDIEGFDSSQNFKSSDSFTAYGIGGKLQLTSLALRAEYEEFDLDNFENLSMFSVGATITF